MNTENVLRFKELLDSNHPWPCDYVFKFIVKIELVDFIKSVFSDTEVLLRPSSKGNYVSLTIKTRMSSSDEVLNVYNKFAGMPGIIAL